MAKNIGLDVAAPEKECNDVNCPFHGSLSVRGQVITGKVVSERMQGTIVVERSFLHKVQKYDRYEKRNSRISAHMAPCLDAKIGDEVKIAECRPLNKTTSYVVVEVTRK